MPGTIWDGRLDKRLQNVSLEFPCSVEFRKLGVLASTGGTLKSACCLPPGHSKIFSGSRAGLVAGPHLARARGGLVHLGDGPEAPAGGLVDLQAGELLLRPGDPPLEALRPWGRCGLLGGGVRHGARMGLTLHLLKASM